MFANWIQRFVKQCFTGQARRVRQRVGRIEAMEMRTLLSASIGVISERGNGSQTLASAVVNASGSQFENFQIGTRWGKTATNGGGLTQGDSTTLTWSFADDGTSIPGFNGEADSASSLIAFLDTNRGAGPGGNDLTQRPWFSLFANSFARMGAISGLTYVYEPNDDAAAFSSSGTASPGVLSTRGDIRIGGHFVDGESGSNVLAYNFFPDNGEMVIDTGNIAFFSSSANNSVGFRNVVMHENGHGIGLNHVESSDGAFLMEPFINTSFDGPQLDDILAIQRSYGDVLEENGGNDTTAKATDLGVIAPGSTISRGDLGSALVVEANATDFLSIDDETDADIFRAQVATNSKVTLTLTPRGTTYQQGPQGGTQSAFNSLAQSNLALQVIAADGTTVLMTADVNAAGGTESITLPLPNGGVFFVKITGSTADVVQMYGISIGVVTTANIPPVINDQTLASVRELSPVGTVVGTVVATDANSSQILTYSVIAGNTGGAFAINSLTGLVTVSNTIALDWEITQVFHLTVQVTDNGVPVRSDTGIVTIEVLDVTTFTFNNGVLTVKGTHLNDKINVQSPGETIKIDDGLSLIETQIPTSSVTTIYLIGLAGNDQLRLDSTLGTGKVSTISGGLGDDVLIGSLGQDTLDGGQGTDEASYVQAVSGVTVSLLLAGSQNTGGAGPDTLTSIENLTGSSFADTLTGNAGANVLSGGAGDDTLNGGLGDDTLIGGQGADALSGGDGNDTLIFDTADTLVSGAAGIDTAKLVNPTAAVNLSLLPGQIEIVDASASSFNNKFDATGASWNVKITGGTGNDTITGGNGNDTLEGGAGNDVIAGGKGADVLNGGHGDDTLKFDNLDTSVIGGPGKDTAVVTDATGPVNLNLALGLIEIAYGAGSTFNNTFNAVDAAWNVTIIGGLGNDTIIGGKAVDTLSGGAGNDTISGGLGNDTIEGGAGADVLEGGDGNDSLTFDNLDTMVNGGAGTDTATAAGLTGGINLNLLTSKLETVNASVSTFKNKFDATGANWIVNIIGGSGADTIYGGNMNDKLYGGAGSDLIIGGLGNDVLDGGAGIDTVSYATATSRVEVSLATGHAVGGAGTDTLTGFENLTGSIYNDTLTGNSGSNIIHSGGGIDKILGGGGTDSIIND